jgi:hypothetical protein
VARRSEKTWKEFTELVAAWQVYVANQHLADRPSVRSSADNYAPIMRFYRETIAAGIDGPPWPKGLMAGLRQGSRETFPQIAGTFRSHPEVVAALRQAGGESLAQLLDYPARVRKMIARGRIRNVDEYYAARARVDDLEGDDTQRAELLAIYALIDRFDLGS